MPSQTTPLAEAAQYLKDRRAEQRYAMDLASALVDKLPIEPFEVSITRAVASFDWHWGVQIHVHDAAVSTFPALREELHAADMTEAIPTAGRTSLLRTLTGSFSGVPFEIRAYVPRTQVAAA